MQFDFDGLIQVIANHLYSEKKVFIRELIQNAHDAIRRRARTDPGFGRIDIETHPQDLRITVRDNGIGMSKDDLVDYLSNIGKSFTRLQKEETEGLIGEFGIGFLSAFVVARHVQVRTRKLGENSGWVWENDGSKSYRLAPCDVSVPGTTVTVLLKEIEDRGLIQESEVRALIRKYADMLSVPIHLNGGHDPENTMHMPWEKAGLTAAELERDLTTYLERTLADSVLEPIPVRLHTPVRAEGVLYISRIRLLSVDQPRTIRVFQNRMFLCENATDVLPQWARFVNGVINTPDLTPTAARDNFIRDEQADQLRDTLGEVIIDHLDRLRQTHPERFTDIVRYHRLGFLAACYYYEAFFRRFAHLLLWRTNDRAIERGDPTRPGTAEMLRTLPEIIADIPHAPGETVRLACFTTASTASQYFDIANAAGGVVVNASYPYESELLEAYTRLPDVHVELAHVDRQDDPSFFRRLSPDEDSDIVRLAESMTLLLRTPAGAPIRTESRRFKPDDIAAVIRSDALSRAQQKAEEVRLDPNVSETLRQIAEELRQMTAQQSRRLTINANNPLIRRLARHDLTDRRVHDLMLAVYNNAILANQELITSQDAAIFHHQFQDLIGRGLDLLDAEGELQAIRDRLREDEERRRATTGRQPRHRIFFMITPFADHYRPLVQACRRVVEERWHAQLIVASDQQDDHRLLDNVELLMGQAHAFIAEITQANPNVMFELGAAFTDRHNRPFALLRERGVDPVLPADLRALLYIDYQMDDAGLEEHLHRELRKNTDIRSLVDDDGWARYLSPVRLRQLLPLVLDATIIERLAARFPTTADWESAETDHVAAILGKRDQDLAEPIITRVLHSGRP
ncbi:ATP-binding protein [Sphaerisporangium sp. NPDC005288]|uniref:ATP-binding protein n=1 Tax=Sphaerisporangium sp. NPDC005288 TaxID=3155114 RepID=UPI0033A60768